MSPYEVPRRREDRDRGVRRSAFEGLFRDNYAGLVRVAWLLVDSKDSAEEIVQEAFMRLFQQWDRLDHVDAAPAYLRATVVNLARSRLRTRSVRRRHRSGPLDPEPAAELRVLARDEENEVLVAMAKLPRRQRECVVLRYYLDLSEAEIASTLGISRGSVKSHTSRALAALSSTLGDDA